MFGTQEDERVWQKTQNGMTSSQNIILRVPRRGSYYSTLLASCLFLLPCSFISNICKLPLLKCIQRDSENLNADIDILTFVFLTFE